MLDAPTASHHEGHDDTMATMNSGDEVWLFTTTSLEFIVPIVSSCPS